MQIQPIPTLFEIACNFEASQYHLIKIHESQVNRDQQNVCMFTCRCITENYFVKWASVWPTEVSTLEQYVLYLNRKTFFFTVLVS